MEQISHEREGRTALVDDCTEMIRSAERSLDDLKQWQAQEGKVMETCGKLQEEVDRLHGRIMDSRQSADIERSRANDLDGQVARLSKHTLLHRRELRDLEEQRDLALEMVADHCKDIEYLEGLAEEAEEKRDRFREEMQECDREIESQRFSHELYLKGALEIAEQLNEQEILSVDQSLCEQVERERERLYDDSSRAKDLGSPLERALADERLLEKHGCKSFDRMLDSLPHEIAEAVEERRERSREQAWESHIEKEERLERGLLRTLDEEFSRGR